MNKQLSDTQLNFYSHVASAAFANPFGTEARKLELNLLPEFCRKEFEQERLQHLIDILGQQFAALLTRDKLEISTYPKPQQEILQISWLFFQYRKHQQQFDQHIKQQKLAGDAPISLSFAESIQMELAKAEYNLEQSAKYIALFFQLRRGFYFINQAISGSSASIIQLRSQLWQNLFSFQPQWYLAFLCEQMEDFSTLILGETGTGKSTIAAAIGCAGYIPFDLKQGKFKESFTRTFQAINLSQYPASLLESELFGHKKGAFTGAIENHLGIFARCSEYGAVFIDEIGETDIPTQVKLLTVIHDRSFTPVRDHKKLRFEGRVIAATNQDIHQLRTKQLFRNDLYYRLCSDVITVPTLQQRLQEQENELLNLTTSIVNKILPDATADFSREIVRRIREHVPAHYSWPGNVRELEQCIRRICLTGAYRIEQNSTPKQAGVLQIDDQPTVNHLITHYCQHLYQQQGSYESVARITGLDRRTVKKYVDAELQNHYKQDTTTIS